MKFDLGFILKIAVVVSLTGMMAWAQSASDMDTEAEGYFSGSNGPGINPPPMTDEFLPGDFAVTDVGTDGVYRITPDGTVELITQGAPIDGPTGIVVDGDGNIIVGNETNENIHVIDPLGTVTFLANVTAHMSNIGDIDLDVNGDYIVVGTSAAVRVTPAGQVTVVHSGSPFTSLQAIAIHPTTGDMYLGNSNGVIWVMDPSGTITELVAAGPIDYIEGMEIDADGNIIVADENGDAVHLVTPTGTVTTVYSGTPLQAPEDICIDANGDYFVTDDPSAAGQDAIYKITPAGVCTPFAASTLYFDILDGIAYYETEITPPSFEVTLVPFTIPIQIPASGGSFEFYAFVTNNQTVAQEADLWTWMIDPSGVVSDPLMGPGTANLQPGTTGWYRAQNISGTGAPGMYSYVAMAGDAPDDVWASDTLVFEKLVTGDGPWVGNWNNWGDPIGDEVVNSPDGVPAEFSLHNAHPNPFNPTTAISYQLSAISFVNLSVYDLSGRKVTELVDGWQEAGSHEVIFNASNLASGIYLYRLNAGSFNASGKMILMK